ncbi:MAG TPA: hypothetical protein VFF64_24425 [Candidatus Eremiobacteraceae bacterium]|nr:hypothetical protein [Candidatus Eremiobacteraceae bacterium]
MDEQTVAVTATKPTPAAKPKKRLYRKKRSDLALEEALRLSQEAIQRHADPSELNLHRTRLVVLNQRLRREENANLAKARTEVDRLSIENDRLKSELAEALALIESQRRAPIDPNETLEQKTARLLQTFAQEQKGIRA